MVPPVPEVHQVRALQDAYDAQAEQIIAAATERRAIIISIPGRRTLAIGPFPFTYQAERGAAALTMSLHSVTHIDGTRIEVGDYNEAYATLPLLPEDPWQLSQLMDYDDEFLAGSPDHYPDLYERLRAQCGNVDAADTWTKACLIYDMEHSPEQYPEASE